jgi:hypothetical protein
VFLTPLKGLIMVLFLLGTSPVFSQDIEEMLFDGTMNKLTEGILDTGRYQSVYAYIIANASTPEIDLEGLLPVADRRRFRQNMPEDQDNMDVMLEFVMARMGENTKKQSAYLLLMKKKMDILRQVISKGQR